MTKRLSIFPTTGEKPTLQAALERIGDGGGLVPAESATMNLSTAVPCGPSSQDGPRMAGKANFGGKKAAHFAKGGGRVSVKKAAAKKYLFGKKK